MFDELTDPPSGDGVVTTEVFRTCRPATIHLISAEGLLLSVVQVSDTFSPAFASVAPEMVTWAGATKNNNKIHDEFF